MKPVSQKARKVLEALIEGLENPGDERKIDNSPGTFMHVYVQCYAPNVFVVAHTYVQEGDLMDDPSMMFWRNEDGDFYPFTFTQHNVGQHQESVQFDDKGRPHRIAPRMQAEHAKFANFWLNNIRAQQKLDAA